MARSSSFGGGGGGRDSGARSPSGDRGAGVSRGTAGGTPGGSSGQKNNFPGYRGPSGTSNPDTSSAGVSQEPRNSGLISTGQTTSYGAPVLVDSKYGVKIALPEKSIPGKAQSWSSWKDQVDKYNQAAREWNGRTFVDRALNFAAPFGLTSVAPDLNHPKTYTGGTFHTGLNPAELGGAVLGAAIPAPGASSVLSKVFGLGYDAAGGRPVMLTGEEVPKDWDPRGAQPADTNKPAPNPMGGLSGERTGAAGAWAGGNPVQNAPGGAPFGAQPVQGGMTGGNPAPTMFTPKIANHSLPKGYESLFPGSLTEEDKKLLYAQALMGGA